MRTLLILIAILIPINHIIAQTIIDVDGNIYNTIEIGTQVWMTENLKTTKYNNDDSIIYITDNDIWDASSEGAYRWYNDSIKYKDIYGALYNWYVVENEMLCPSGWHVPSNDDWDVLVEYNGGIFVAGGKLKESDTIHWVNPNVGATNESGFTGLPGGEYFDGQFYGLGESGFWWSQTEEVRPTNAYSFCLTNFLETTAIDTYQKTRGFSVRCVQDNTTYTNDTRLNDEIYFYPNPSKDLIYLINVKPNSRIILFDAQNKQFINKHIDSNTLDISILPKGTYFIEIIDNDYILTNKLIKI
jgi:uncharacterized protein (TIGR02145 family)